MATHAQETFHAFQNAVAHNISNFDNSFLSDEEEEDYCPLCIEPLDVTDKNFFPCPCGYQICQFCYNNIRQNPELNGRCPACRRKYDDENVRYVVLSSEEIKMERANQAKKERERKQREKERKENEYSNRKHLAGVRVIQKNLVYVVGVNPPVPYEEVANTLKSDKYFGQYGKINKIVVNRKNPHPNDNYHHHSPGYGVYITFAAKDDAAKCIAQVDGTYMDSKLIKAAYGTTKYCSSYLRGSPCQNPNCMFLHEPGEEADSFNKRELHNKQQLQQNAQAAAVAAPHSLSTPTAAIYNKPTATSFTNNLSSLNTYQSASSSPAPIKAQLHNDTGTSTPVLTPAPAPSGSNPWGITQSSTPITSLNLSKSNSTPQLPTLADALTQNNIINISNTSNNITTNTINITETQDYVSQNKKKNITSGKDYVDPYDCLGSAVRFLDERIRQFSNYNNHSIKLKSDIIDDNSYDNYPSLFTWNNVEPSKKSDNTLTKKLIEILAIKPTDYSASVVQFLQSVNNNNFAGNTPGSMNIPLNGQSQSSAGTPIPQNINMQVPNQSLTGTTIPPSPPGIYLGQQDGAAKDNGSNNSSDLLNQLINGRRLAAAI